VSLFTREPTNSSVNMTNFLLLLLLVLSLSTADAFSNMLVERAIGCMTFLEEGEVIMNYGVTRGPRENYEGVALHITADGETMERRRNGSTYIPGEILRVGLHVPDTVSHHREVQFVVEIVEGDTDVVSTSSGSAAFKDASSGCDGRRANGSSKKKLGPALLMPMDGRDVKIVAGWATGHEAVTLTDEVILKSVGKSKEIDGKKNAKNIGAEKERELPEILREGDEKDDEAIGQGKHSTSLRKLFVRGDTGNFRSGVSMPWTIVLGALIVILLVLLTRLLKREEKLKRSV